jgi:hypothetical protein
MRSLILAVVMAVVAAGAASAQETPAAVQTTPSQDYTDEWRRNFIAGCVEGSNGLQSNVCECSLRSIELVVPFAESDALDREHAAGRPGNRDTIETYRSIVQSCLAASDA